MSPPPVRGWEAGNSGGLPLALEGEGRPRDPQGRDHPIQLAGGDPLSQKGPHHRLRFDAAPQARPEDQVPSRGGIAGTGADVGTGAIAGAIVVGTMTTWSGGEPLDEGA